MYLRRFDLRALLDDLQTDVVGRAVIENPERFKDDLLRDLLAKHFARVRVVADAHQPVPEASPRSVVPSPVRRSVR